jgi:glycolate oxidase iron-sulfur subunit
MQTNLADFVRNTPQGQEADDILRKCVHCGFCTATCPTYQLLGDELDGPRGRIYLIKQLLEGSEVTAKTQLHLDRCLTCRACETTCPSGVRYGRLADIGRQIVEARVKRGPVDAIMRRTLRWALPYPRRFTPLLRLGQTLRPLLPGVVKQKVPPRQTARSWPGLLRSGELSPQRPRRRARLHAPEHRRLVAAD